MPEPVVTAEALGARVPTTHPRAARDTSVKEQDPAAPKTAYNSVVFLNASRPRGLNEAGRRGGETPVTGAGLLPQGCVVRLAHGSSSIRQMLVSKKNARLRQGDAKRKKLRERTTQWTGVQGKGGCLLGRSTRWAADATLLTGISVGKETHPNPQDSKSLDKEGNPTQNFVFSLADNPATEPQIGTLWDVRVQDAGCRQTMRECVPITWVRPPR